MVEGASTGRLGSVTPGFAYTRDSVCSWYVGSVLSHGRGFRCLCALAAAAAGLALPTCTYDFDAALDGAAVDASSDPNPPQDGPGQDHVELDAAPDVTTDAVPDTAPEAQSDGADDPGCPPDTKLCEGVCLGLDNPQAGCASPGCSPCSIPHAKASCSGGACALGTCDSGWGNCNNDPADGCETDLQADTDNCAACGHVCTNPAGTPACVAGVCTIPYCDPGNAQIAACYQFDTPTNPGLDGSMYGNHATTSGISIVAGHDGNAVQTGSGATIAIGESESLDVSAITVEMWIYPTTLPAGSARAGLLDNDAQYAMFIYPDGVLSCTTGNACGAFQSPTGAVKLSQWQHVACANQGGNVTVYVDGTLVASGICSTPINKTATNGTRLGSNCPSGDPFTGRLDDVRIWNVGLTRAQICAGAGLACP